MILMMEVSLQSNITFKEVVQSKRLYEISYKFSKRNVIVYEK